MTTYTIRTYKPVESEEVKEPELRGWYCGFIADYYIDAEPGLSKDLDGHIAQYMGDGEFIDEYGEEVNMRQYDYLVRQD